MKNLSIILNLVLLVAVGYLYYLHHRDCSAPVSSGTVITGSGMPANAIVFINSDSLLEGYDYFNDLKDHLEQKSDSIDRVLRSRAEQLEKDVMKYQDRAPGLSPQQRAEEEEKLMTRQQGLMEYKNLMLDQLSEEESVMNDSLHSNLTRFLRDYNKDRNYLYILGYQRGSGILLANDSLDITPEVLKGLNAQ